MQALETQRLLLQPFTTADAPFILTLLNKPSFIRFIGDKKVRTLEDARQYLLNGQHRARGKACRDACGEHGDVEH